MNRREFLKRIGLLGGGVIVYFSYGNPTAIAQPRAGTGQQGQLDFNAFLSIGADGKIACFTGKIEMGQGVITSLAQMAAEELEAPFDAIEMIMGDTEICPWDQGTWGSMTTRFFGPKLREAAAEARGVLLELAAEHLKVPAARLIAKEGVIFDKTQPGTRVTYGQLTQGKTIERRLKERPPSKAAPELSVIGKPYLRKDSLEKVTGKAKYAGDIRLPGMLYARLLRAPAHGAARKRVDASGARQMLGVLVVEEGDLIAVLHEHPDTADEALEKIRAEFEPSKSTLDHKNIFDHLLRVAPEGTTLKEGGSLESGRGLAAQIFETTYSNSYVSHAALETHTALAEVKDGRATVWASTQSPFGVRDQVAGALGLSPGNVRVKPVFVGGGFGGKSASAQALEAARLAKLTGKPVQVAWSREEEFFRDTFMPAAIVKIKSGVDGSGNMVLWDYEVCFAGSDGADLFYDIPHHREISRGSWQGSSGYHPHGTGPWRAPATNTNCFARESQVDLMASRAGRDPLEYRLHHLTDKRMRRVLEAAAEKFGWTRSKAPSGRGYGVACGNRSGAYVATLAEVAVDKTTGEVSVRRMVHAQDMGLVINPEGAKLQMEGCLVMGLGYALKEEIHFRNGEILDRNFDTYEIPRFSWVPKIETVLIESDSAPQGGGEPAIVCVGAVIANAIYDAVGARMVHFPMTPERILGTLRKRGRAT
ncbi:MAG: molybdopterin cofactor-binding domain-containing protein [Deltaproteobacteria bacterium]